jgi:hypothetical protein
MIVLSLGKMIMTMPMEDGNTAPHPQTSRSRQVEEWCRRRLWGARRSTAFMTEALKSVRIDRGSR